MADLKKLNTSIDRFLLNEKRIEKFINDEEGYIAETGVYVPSLKELAKKIESGDIVFDTLEIGLHIYQSYAEANTDLQNRNDGTYARVLIDETRDNRDSIYIIVNRQFQFVKYEDFLPAAIDSGTY